MTAFDLAVAAVSLAVGVAWIVLVWMANAPDRSTTERN